MTLKQGSALTETLQNNLKHRLTSSEINLVQETDDVLATIGASVGDSGGKLSFYGADPIVKSVLRVASMPAIALAAKAVMIAKIWKMRTGHAQDIHVDVRKALHRFAGFGEMRWIKMNGNLPLINADPDNPLTPLGPREDTFLTTRDGAFMTTSNFLSARARSRFQAPAMHEHARRGESRDQDLGFRRAGSGGGKSKRRSFEVPASGGCAQARRL